jgi:hypothetical protein
MYFGSISTAFALSRNLGTVTNASAVFASGFVQDPAVQYVDPTGRSQQRHPYFMTEYSSSADLVSVYVPSCVHQVDNDKLPPDRRFHRRL